MTPNFVSIVPVWAAVVVAIIVLGIASPPSQYFTWLQVALAGATIVTFVIQLSHPVKEGLVTRIMLSLGGSVLLLAVATTVLWPLSA